MGDGGGSRFILLSGPEDGINGYVFPLAILLAKGRSSPWDPCTSGHSMREWMNVPIIGCYDVVTHAERASYREGLNGIALRSAEFGP